MGDRQEEALPRGERHYARALRELSHVYERLVQGLSILEQVDAIDDPSLELHEVSLRLLEAIATGLSAENCSLMLLTEDEEHLELLAARSALEEQGKFFGRDSWQGKTFHVGEGIVGTVAARGEPVRIDDVSGDVSFIPLPDSPIRVRSLMCFPLLVEDKVLGVLNLSHSEPGYFSVESEQIVSLVASRSARLLASHVVHHLHRRSEKHYQLVCDNAGDAILVFDEQGRILNANRMAEQLTGIPLADFLDGKVDWMARVVADDRPEVVVQRNVIRELGTTETVEYRYRAADGEIHSLEDHGSSVLDPAGKYGGLVSVIRDVTERKRIEEEKLRLEDQLRHSQKMELIGSLAGGLAHDFNNLLTGIIGNLNLARVKAGPGCSDPLLGDALRASQRAAAVARQLLVFTRRSALEIKPTDLVDLVEEVAQLVRNTFDPRLEIVLEKQPEAVSCVQADSGQIHQVLMNLCVNARDALLTVDDDDCDSVLRITLQIEQVELGLEECNDQTDAKPGEHVCLTVSDTGPGMDESTMGLVFSPFFTTKIDGKGTGLGLSIVSDIIRQHGGWITLESAPGKGTVFRVFLPTAGDVELAEAQAAAEEEPPRGTETVLMVDDEEIVLDLGCAILEHLGYSVMVAKDGEEAVEVYTGAQDRIDLVVLDLSMPRLSGLAAMARIRELNPEARVVLSSGHAMDELDGSEFPCEPSARLAKPYTPLEMAKALRVALDQEPSG